jgi:hypothetical protein
MPKFLKFSTIVMLKKYTLLPLSFLLLAFEISNSQIIQDAFNRDKKPKQERPDTRIPLNSPADRSLRQPERPHSLLDRQRQGLTELTAQPLEGAIDPETYLVGPGDRFMIDVLSSMEDFFIVTVTPEGRLVIPTMGSLQVYGETLARVKEMVRTAGEKKYLHTQVEANPGTCCRSDSVPRQLRSLHRSPCFGRNRSGRRFDLLGL